MEVLLLSSGEGVGAYPGVGDGDAWSDAESRQVSRQGALQQVGAPTHRILCLAHVQALGKETRVVRCLGSGAKWWNTNEFLVHMRLHAF